MIGSDRCATIRSINPTRGRENLPVLGGPLVKKGKLLEARSTVAASLRCGDDCLAVRALQNFFSHD